MRRFRFGLAKVLELRQYREQEAKNELGKAIGTLTAIENEITANAEKRVDATQQRFESINTSGEDSRNGIFIQQWDNYILRLEREAEFLAERAAQAEQVVEEKRNLYLEASRELKVIEKLKEKRQKEYRKEMFAAETRELDDIFRTVR
jgi:flagellar FliJ protein